MLRAPHRLANAVAARVSSSKHVAQPNARKVALPQQGDSARQIGAAIFASSCGPVSASVRSAGVGVASAFSAPSSAAEIAPITGAIKVATAAAAHSSSAHHGVLQAPPAAALSVDAAADGVLLRDTLGLGLPPTAGDAATKVAAALERAAAGPARLRVRWTDFGEPARATHAGGAEVHPPVTIKNDYPAPPHRQLPAVAAAAPARPRSARATDAAAAASPASAPAPTPAQQRNGREGPAPGLDSGGARFERLVQVPVLEAEAALGSGMPKALRLHPSIKLGWTWPHLPQAAAPSTSSSTVQAGLLGAALLVEGSVPLAALAQALARPSVRCLPLQAPALEAEAALDSGVALGLHPSSKLAWAWPRLQAATPSSGSSAAQAAAAAREPSGGTGALQVEDSVSLAALAQPFAPSAAVKSRATASPAPRARPSSLQWRLQGAVMGPSQAHARAFSTNAGLQVEGKNTEDKPKPASGPVPLFIQLPGSSSFEGIRVDATAFVSDVKKAIITEFKLDAAPQQLQLFKLDAGGSRSSSKALEPTQTLAEADLLSATGSPIKLEVVRTEAATAGAAIPVPQLLALVRTHAGQHFKQGVALHHPRSLTPHVPQLSGIEMASLLPSSAQLPAGFIHRLEEVRGPSLKAIATGFAERMHKRANASAADSTYRLLNPLVALQSSPGGGKSTVLDCAALLSTHGLWSTFCKDGATCKALHASVPVAVTYNSGSNAKVTLYDRDVETGLALRILHSFFAPTMAFAKFAELPIASGNALTAYNAVECCLAALRECSSPKRGILLLVDEVIKLGAKENVDKLISVVGSLLDAFAPEQLNAVCTTLNATAFVSMHTKSERRIVWAPLPALEQQPVERMVEQALQVHPLPPAVRVALSDCAGHPRTQEYVMQAARELQRADPRGWTKDQVQCLQKLRAAVIAQLGGTAEPWAVCAALEGKALALSQPVPAAGTKDSLRVHIANGVFVNTDIIKPQKVVPKLSLLSLLASQHPGDVTELEPALQELADVDTDALLNGRQMMGGEPFERFVAHWLRVRLLVAAERGSTFTLHQLLLAPLQHGHRACGARLDTQLLAAELKTSRVTGVQVVDRKLQDAVRDGLVLQPNMVYLFGDSNPGFDSLVLLERKQGSRVALAIESRYTRVHGAHSDDLEEVRRKQMLWKEAQQVLEKSCGVQPGHSMLVYLAVRDVELGALPNREKLEQANLLVLDRDAATTLLTPTLASRAFFTIDFSRKKQ